MSKIVIFGAGGRAGRQAVAEARRRGHEVTAVVRDLSRHNGLADSGARVAAGDVTDVADVAALAAGHDAAIHAAAVYGAGTDPDAFFTGAAHALVNGLRQAGVDRLVAVGLSALLPGPRRDQVAGRPRLPGGVPALLPGPHRRPRSAPHRGRCTGLGIREPGWRLRPRW